MGHPSGEDAQPGASAAPRSSRSPPAEHPSLGTGTVMRRPTFARYALDAGFRTVDELPVENDFYRFYRLTA